MPLNSTKIVKRAASLGLAATFLATTFLPVSTASADHRKRYKRHHSHEVVVIEKHHRYYKKRKKRRKQRHNNGEALAAGIIGFAIGAIVADQAIKHRQPQRVYVQPEPRPVYVKPRRHYEPLPRYHDEPKVIRYEDSVRLTYEPWTPEWRNWCSSKYRSFNAGSGTYRGYDGRDHFCVVR